MSEIYEVMLLRYPLCYLLGSLFHDEITLRVPFLGAIRVGILDLGRHLPYSSAIPPRGGKIGNSDFGGWARLGSWADSEDIFHFKIVF